jgi:SAM-dependent methyltransferase
MIQDCPPVTHPSVGGGAVMAWRDGACPEAGRVERAIERAIAIAYGVAYDGVVSGFAPYQALLDDIVDVLARAGHGRRLRILDVACGTGTLARRLARAGHTVTGLDLVAHLVARARRHSDVRVRFAHADVSAGASFPDASFDACVSLHTLNWHPRPLALLRECRRLLRPGGHAVIACYTRPPALRATFGAVRAAHGVGAAIAALRWLAPTAVFEACRHYDARYPDAPALHQELAAAGFDTVESRPVFLAGVSRLVRARLADCGSDDHDPTL